MSCSTPFLDIHQPSQSQSTILSSHTNDSATVQDIAVFEAGCHAPWKHNITPESDNEGSVQGRY